MCKMRGDWGDDIDYIFIPVADIGIDVSKQTERRSNMKNECHIQAWRNLWPPQVFIWSQGIKVLKRSRTEVFVMLDNKMMWR